MDEIQEIQEIQYDYPYHYIPLINKGNFLQTQHWSWGFRYLGGLQVVLDQLEALNFKSLIDVGCGDGRFLREVRNLYDKTDLLGVDYSKRAIDIAKALNPHIQYREVNILKEKLDKKFALATAIEVLEHIPPNDLSEFVNGISDLLNDKGYFILTVPHQNKRVSDKHYQHFSSDKLGQILSPYFSEINFIPFDSPSRILNYFSRFLGGNGGNFVITNSSLNNWFFNTYKNRFLYTEDENYCLRIAAVCKK